MNTIHHLLHTFNRTVVIVLDLVLLILLLLMLLTIFGATGLLPASMTGTLADLGGIARAAVVALVVLIFLVGSVLLYYELRPPRIHRTVRLPSSDATNVVVQTESLRKLIQHTTRDLPDVQRVLSDMVMTRQGLNVHCRLIVRQSAQIDQIKHELDIRVRQEFARHLDVPIADVGIWTDLEALRYDTAG